MEGTPRESVPAAPAFATEEQLLAVTREQVERLKKAASYIAFDIGYDKAVDRFKQDMTELNLERADNFGAGTTGHIKNICAGAYREAVTRL